MIIFIKTVPWQKYKKYNWRHFRLFCICWIPPSNKVVSYTDTSILKKLEWREFHELHSRGVEGQSLASFCVNQSMFKYLQTHWCGCHPKIMSASQWTSEIIFACLVMQRPLHLLFLHSFVCDIKTVLKRIFPKSQTYLVFFFFSLQIS